MSGEELIFAGGAGDTRRPRWPFPVSLAVHGILLIALFHARSPIFVAPSSVLGGARGTAITHLYWAAGTAETESGVARGSQDHRNSRARLTWKKPQRTETASNRDTPGPDPSDDGQKASTATSPAPAAGSPYGSLSDGSLNGQEIRPALPMITSEPLVSSEDLRGSVEGNVVIEITIDESGNIVNKVVVQSLGAATDAKVLAALENWRFRPATRDGVPIPSKQDVVYHFKPR